MEDLESAISGVLNNPEMMKTIMGMAQSLGGLPTDRPPEDGPDKAEGSAESAVQPGLGQLQQLTGLLGKAQLDTHQQALLTALSPYMSSSRIGKLRKAMQAAHLAELASSMLGGG